MIEFYASEPQWKYQLIGRKGGKNTSRLLSVILNNAEHSISLLIHWRFQFKYNK